MSFDTNTNSTLHRVTRLNPFGTGQCLSTNVKFGDAVSSAFVSIPLEQGNVFRLQCWYYYFRFSVSIPLEQGNVFRLLVNLHLTMQRESQSLWNRAMSFDSASVTVLDSVEPSQSLWNRAMSFDLNSVTL